MKDEERPGRPATPSTDAKIEQVRGLILDNRQVTLMKWQTIYKLLLDKVCERWVPRQLSEVQTQNRLRISQLLLDFQTYKKTIAGKETWIHHFEPESEHQSMEWKHPESPFKKKFKSQPFAGKVMLTLFWHKRANSGTELGEGVNSKQ
ncbi:hypothetical protein J437_LFUL015226 [Ladona fulva]|uniref:Uncharacterized protein n=1 Tax=Ladona fulva TaxID=123851 RepID=A0A8K0P5Q2_LADFU|nr:hypothetical protein J437_LFUL015226 [Ladona fulva]